MTMFVHLTTESIAARIRRVGITRLRRLKNPTHGFYAMPVVPNFSLTHQWLRELKRGRGGPMVGVYFRLAADQPVWVADYRHAHQPMTAAQVVAMLLRGGSLEGYETIVPRKIAPREIHRIRHLPQTVGWRYMPGSHGRRPCGCPMCQRGQYGARKIRAQDPENN